MPCCGSTTRGPDPDSVVLPCNCKGWLCQVWFEDLRLIGRVLMLSLLQYPWERTQKCRWLYSIPSLRSAYPSPITLSSDLNLKSIPGGTAAIFVKLWHHNHTPPASTLPPKLASYPPHVGSIETMHTPHAQRTKCHGAQASVRRGILAAADPLLSAAPPSILALSHLRR